MVFFFYTFVCIRKEEKKDGCIKIEGALVNAAAMHWDTFFVIVYFSVVESEIERREVNLVPRGDRSHRVIFSQHALLDHNPWNWPILNVLYASTYQARYILLAFPQIYFHKFSIFTTMANPNMHPSFCILHCTLHTRIFS